MLFRFLRAPFLSDLAFVPVLVAPEAFFVEILIAEDFATFALAVELLFVLDAPEALPVGDLGLTVVFAEDDDNTGAAIPLSVAMLVSDFIGVPAPSNFTEWALFPIPVVDVILPPAGEAPLEEEVVPKPSVALSLAEIGLVVVLAPALSLRVDAAVLFSSADVTPSLDGVEESDLGNEEPSSVITVASVVVGVVDFPDSASLFSLLPVVLISIVVDDSVFSLSYRPRG